MRQFIQKIVEEANLDLSIVGEAADGRAALEQFDALNPDIVTMDITMPHMDGLTCMQEMLARKPETRIIVVTALNSRSIQMDALEQGAVAFLNKPIKTEKLKEIVLSLIPNERAPE